MAVRAEGDYNDMSHYKGYKVSGFVSDTNSSGTLGGLIGVVYSDQKFRTDALNYSTWDPYSPGVWPVGADRRRRSAPECPASQRSVLHPVRLRRRPQEAHGDHRHPRMEAAPNAAHHDRRDVHQAQRPAGRLQPVLLSRLHLRRERLAGMVERHRQERLHHRVHRQQLRSGNRQPDDPPQGEHLSGRRQR